MESRSEEILRIMEQQLEGTAEEKLRFFRLDELKRNISRLGAHSPGCEECGLFIPEAEAMASRIGEAVSVPGEERRELDRLIFRLSNHMMKDHGYYPTYHFSFRYSIWGIFLGLAVGYLLERISPLAEWYWLLTGGLMAGLFIGQVMGRIRDRKIREAGKVM